MPHIISEKLHCCGLPRAADGNVAMRCMNALHSASILLRHGVANEARVRGFVKYAPMCWSCAQQLQPFIPVGAQIIPRIKTNIVHSVRPDRWRRTGGDRSTNPQAVSGLRVCYNQEKEVIQMKKLFVAFLKDEEGLTMVEYAIAGALVAAGAVGAFTTLGNNIVTKITQLAGDVLGTAS